MSELQAYYDEFRAGYWAHPDASECRCKGRGWAISEVDTVHECRYHFVGQPHPDADIPDDMSYEEYEAHCVAEYKAEKAAKASAPAHVPFFTPSPSDKLQWVNGQWVRAEVAPSSNEDEIPF